MGDKPFDRKISAIFTAVSAIALLSPHNLTLDSDKPAEPAAPTYQTLHPVGTPTEHVDPIPNLDGGGSLVLGGGSISFPTALAVKIGRP